jgi:hypothetical protein
LDDADRSGVAYTGEWLIASNEGSPGIGYYLGTRWARKGTGEAKAAFTPNVRKAGRYTVYAWFGPDPVRDHASDAPVTITSAKGARTVRVDLKPLTGSWAKLGTFEFGAGKKGSITFSNNANGNVMADAVKLVPAS